MNSSPASSEARPQDGRMSFQEVMANHLAAQPTAIRDDATEIVLGAPPHRYRLVSDWARMPDGWRFADVAAVDVLPDDQVVVFGRSENPLMIFDRDGNLLHHWGKGLFTRPHGVHFGHDSMLYCVDDGDHTVRKCTLEGEVVMTLGRAGCPAPYMSGKPFARPTDIALSPSGDIYVTDGYLNAHVHKFAPDGRHLLTWGASGTGPGEFNIPHNIVCDPNGWIYVADRENHRIQVFDPNGRFETQWNYFHRPAALRRHSSGTFLVGELGPSMAHIRYAPNLGPRVRLASSSGDIIVTLGDQLPADAADRFIAPHGIAMDSAGDIYVGEVATAFWPSLFPGVPTPSPIRALRKLVRMPDAS